MNRYEVNKKALVMSLIVASLMTSPVSAFDSGSTGADGAFSPTVNTTLQLPPSGIFNFTTVNIPTGVTVTYTKNTTNTPVVMLASGNVTIAGTLSVNGVNAKDVGAAGDGNLGDDGIPGKGGPGGYDGGAGGVTGPNTTASQPLRMGGAGLGPGGGLGGNVRNDFIPCGGGGAGFSGAGANDNCGFSVAGAVYGSSVLLPLVGGSGGGGGSGGIAYRGSGGGGGGGALLIASSGTVSITGSITANGSSSGANNGTGTGATGGAGSGGAIRIVATTISGNGTITATNGGTGACALTGCGGGSSVGRVRLEAENITRTATSNPAHVFGAPSTVFVAGLPTLRITRVAGVDAPAQPTGNADITLPASTPNPVTVEFATTGVPVGNTVKLAVTPATGVIVTATTSALTGTTDNATASVSVNLPSGPNVLQATVSYTVVASVGDLLGVQFAKGERVEKIELAAGMNGSSMTTLITVSGKRYTVPSLIPAMGKAG